MLTNYTLRENGFGGYYWSVQDTITPSDAKLRVRLHSSHTAEYVTEKVVVEFITGKQIEQFYASEEEINELILALMHVKKAAFDD